MKELLEYLALLNEFMDDASGVVTQVRMQRRARKMKKARSNWQSASARASAAGKPVKVSGGGMAHPRVSGGWKKGKK